LSFIYDYSKFAWIYMLYHKAEMSKYFLEFHKLVERMLGRKIIAILKVHLGPLVGFGV
jgi:hypothetical protein